jgi:hypothetical protein
MRLKYMAVRDWIKETLRTTFPISYYAPGHEFRHLQKSDGTMEMQVRYINSGMGYTGKWVPVNTVQEEANKV